MNRLVERLLLNFNYHVEHHLFPRMSPKYLPPVAGLLKESWPDRYHSWPYGQALLAVWRTPRAYRDAYHLCDPPRRALYGHFGTWAGTRWVACHLGNDFRSTLTLWKPTTYLSILQSLASPLRMEKAQVRGPKNNHYPAAASKFAENGVVMGLPQRVPARLPDNNTATRPHPTDQRPLRGKLNQAKKIIASGLSEAEAIERAKAGDAESFEALYGLHKRRVYSLCLRMTSNTAEAEDLTQEAFLQLYRKIATFRGESAFSTWLHRLSVNVVLMHLRKKGLPEVSLDEALEPQHEDGPRKDIGARDNVLAGSIDRVNLERAIESLPPGYRIIFVLHDIEGYEHNEIAEMMGCSIGNSKSQLHKARMKLRDLLKLSRAEKALRR